ncbi:MAG: DNA repair protein RecO [Prevotellaceae bacterium]|jgi:DNA repair protein RecO (recombination protein O)|nr:DNA repair protein RecO [Prevotellaceae bacterium]
MNYKLKGVVLHTVKYRDNSLIIYLYTDLYGRKSFLVRGGRRGKLPAGLHPLSLIEFEANGGRKSELHCISEYHRTKVLDGIIGDVRKNAIALFAGELLYRLLRDEQADASLFAFVFNSVCMLDELRAGVANFHLHFMVHLSRYLGFSMPDKADDDTWFDIKSGRFTILRPLHPQFFEKEDTLILSRLLNCPASSVSEIELSGEQRHKFLAAMLKFYSFRFDCNILLRSPSVLHEVFI